MNRFWPKGLAAIALIASTLSHADVLIGQTADFSGPVASGVKETAAGAKLWIDHVNAGGGINGEPITLVSMDDKFEPANAAANARTLIVDKKVLALFLTRGTPHNQAILPLLSEFGVPLIAPSTGAMALHKPVNPWVFNVRASYQHEANRAIRHLSLVGLAHIGIVQVNDSFGSDAVKGALDAFAQVNGAPLFTESYDREKPDFTRIQHAVTTLNPQAILFLGSGSAVVNGVKAIRATGSHAQIVTLSNNASDGFIKALGDNATGTIVTQVFPYERSLASPMVKEARQLQKAATGDDKVTPAMLEGFAGAKVLVEGLRRAGKNPTREKLRAALETLHHYDIGGLEVSFSPTSHTGLDYTDLSIIGSDGKFTR
ncbi:ABC transporter substrate-binding protein [Scleromatobacter humisilvae]|uniref:ABC transporter substrate-binding protein n=1 Tax=Scleromatobacter humisilvae TaxID=2897159 RepID=A0A9X2C3K5_9BURK|nr:ABC transporter substrate-binding protein [Scleromatobacter humisilvae]MCK9688384.1 ABC transporter substrate-binding protein [Scleromatobacter humisilvae]